MASGGAFHPRMSDVFISYCRADAGWAGRLLECLEDRFDVFFDTEDIAGGDISPERIEPALAACRVCCVAIGPEWGRCCVPDDCIDPKRRALFVSRAVMRGLIEQLRSELT